MILVETLVRNWWSNGNAVAVITKTFGQYGYTDRLQQRIKRKDIFGRIKMTLVPRIDMEQEFTKSLQSHQLAQSHCVGGPVYGLRPLYKLPTRHRGHSRQHPI